MKMIGKRSLLEMWEHFMSLRDVPDVNYQSGPLPRNALMIALILQLVLKIQISLIRRYLRIEELTLVRNIFPALECFVLATSWVWTTCDLTDCVDGSVGVGDKVEVVTRGEHSFIGF
jgi:hypothetical protein